METVISPDGARIAYACAGAGVPLLLIPGTGAANPAAWTAVFPALAQQFRACGVDRRGRGASGDGPTYSLAREAEDIAAVAAALGSPTYVLGHSYGGLVALEAALIAPNIHKLILYEPAVGPLGGSPLYPPGLLDRVAALSAAGDREGALVLHYRENVGMSPAELEQFKSSPAWGERVALAHTLAREMRAEENYTFDARRFEDLRVPTLLLQGGDSPEFLKGGVEALAAALPESRLAVLPGQQHIAMYTAPDLFLRVVLDFLNPSGPLD